MLPLASLSLTPDYGDELWALPALDIVSVFPLIRDDYNDYEAGHMLHQGEDVELNEYWSGGLTASRSCSAGLPSDQVPSRDSGKCKRRYWTAPQEQFKSLLGAIWGGAIPWCPLRPRRISWYGGGLVAASSGLVTKSTPHATQSHHPITTRGLKERHLLWPLSGRYVKSTTV